MKRFLKFFALVLFLVPAWIGFLTLTGEDKSKQRPSVGPLVALEQALQDAGDGRWVSDMVAMVPLAPANAWRLEGLVALPEGSSDVRARPFAATMHTKCLPHSDATCWVVDRLDYPAAGDTPADAAGSNTYPEDDTQLEKLSIVQDRLRELGFDPGASDGVMGWQTQQAVAAYIARTKGSDDAAAQALVELEATARLARAAQHHARGDYHAALEDYAKVVELDPANARALFNRGLIFQDLGLTGLAIANYDRALDLRADHAMAYHSRGNAHFVTGDYWAAFADHADGLGVRYLGERYLVLRDRLGEVRDQVAPGFAVVLNWAQGAWDHAKQTVAEKLRRSAEDSGENAT